ncbi:hypothetical protein J2S74_000662 [Evansella vedderi]|uniref:Uncharacterized protein n=1 Tax=Evansella vedderi TaxID=38282 RepID=A0ABT9ZPX5_9BACI|nr:hypothetical protein [Evansella vedderi]
MGRRLSNNIFHGKRRENTLSVLAISCSVMITRSTLRYALRMGEVRTTKEVIAPLCPQEEQCEDKKSVKRPVMSTRRRCEDKKKGNRLVMSAGGVV